MTTDTIRFANADRCSKRNPCRVCGGEEWPCVNLPARDDGTEKSVCGVEANLYGTDGTWVENLGGWLHTTSDAPQGVDLQPRNGIATAAPRINRVKAATLEFRSRVYEKLLPQTPLIEEHREHLRGGKRGYNDEQMNARGYASGWSAPSRQTIEEWVAKDPDAALSIPGIGEQGLLAYEPRRILIPVRDHEGHIQGLQAYNPNAANKKDRYRWVSSAGARGAGLTPPPLHVSRPTKGSAEGPVWLTEGPFKADICSDKLGAVVVAFQGVDTLRMRDLDEVLEALGEPELIVAIDADREHNADVRRVFERLCEHLRQRGTRFAVASWDADDGKGLDDLLLNGGSPRVEWQEEAAEDSRAFIERSFVSIAMVNLAQAHVLRSFPDDAFQDRTAKETARAIRRILDRGEDPNANYVGAEMGRRGAFGQYQEILTFEAEHTKRLARAAKTSAAAFREAWMVDQARATIAEMSSTVGVVPFKQWAAASFAKFTPLIAEAETSTSNTYREDMEEWCEAFLRGEHEKDLFYLFPGELGHAIGKVGPECVCVLGGDAKMGKTSLCWEPVFYSASQGRGVIVGGLELSKSEQCKRGACWLLKKPYRDIADDDVRRLMKNGKLLSMLANIKLITKVTNLDHYCAEVARICASKPGHYRLLVTDQTEMVMDHGGKNGVSDEGAKVAKRFKDLAIVWDLCHLALHQYRREYLEKDGQNGPRPYHIANSKKPEKDCQVMILIHRPSLFREDCQEDYIEIHIPVSRSDAGGKVVPMKWHAAEYRYEDWGADTPLPVGCGRSLDEQTRRKPLGALSASRESTPPARAKSGRNIIDPNILMEETDFPI